MSKLSLPHTPSKNALMTALLSLLSEVGIQ